MRTGQRVARVHLQQLYGTRVDRAGCLRVARARVGDVFPAVSARLSPE